MIKASMILAAALCMSWLLRKRAASLRHVVWASAIIAASLLPVLSLLLPSWQPRFAQRLAAALPGISALTQEPNPEHQTGVTFRAVSIESGIGWVWRVLWLAGSITALLSMATGILYRRRLARRSVLQVDQELTAIMSDLVRDCGLRRSVRLRRSVDQPMPMTWGIFRPQVLLPNAVSEWSGERKRVALAHELAHVQRSDWLFQTVAQIACAIYWFNPLFWMASNRLYRESELACDDVVVNLGVDSRDYASHLLWIARAVRRSGGMWQGTVAMARPSALEKRFAALLRSAPDRRVATRKTIFSVAAFVGFLTLPLAAIRVSETAAFPAVDVMSAVEAGSRTTDMDSTPPQVEQYRAPPLYSDEARTRGIEGVVTLQVQVDRDGVVQRLQIVKGLGYGLDENALLAVRDWRFLPARRGGIAIAATTQIDVEFNLRTAALNEEIANDMAARIGPGVTPPQVVHRIEAQYPSTMNRPKPAGAVVLDAVIPEDGSPRIIRVIRSLDWELDEIAVDALEQWKFSPAMKDDQPVKVRMNIAVNFNPN